MRNSYFPNQDRALAEWSRNFALKLSNGGDAYGVDAETIAQFVAIEQTWADALNRALDPTTRTVPAVADKNDARAAMKSAARDIVSIVQGQKRVTPAMKMDLGITVRKTTRSKVVAPSTPPGIAVESVSGFDVKIRVYDRDSETGRGKPATAQGASIFTYIGEQHPTSLDEYQFHGNVGRTNLTVSFSSSLAPGTRVWITALWFSTRKQNSLLANPISTNLQGGGVSHAEMKLAA